MKLFTKTLTAALTTCIGVVGISAIGTAPVLKNQSDFFGKSHSESVTKDAVLKAFHSASKVRKSAYNAEAQSELNEGNIYAYLGGGNYSKTMGMYKLFQDGGYEYMWTEALLDKSFVMQTGWLRDGVLCGFAQFGVGTWVLGYAYEELDLATGEAVREPRLIDLDDNYLGYYQIAAYNPDNDRVYGYGYVEKAGDRSVFKSSPASEPDKATIVKPDYVPAEACLALCYNDEKGTLAGINLNHEFVYIDLDGNQTSVMELGIEGLQNIVSAMTWSAADGYYLFNAIIEGSQSELYAIDPEEETVTLLSSMSDGLTFAFMVSPDGGVTPDAPEVPSITRLTFEDGDNSGMLVFNLPTTNGKGESLDSNLEYSVWIDGTIWDHSYERPGEMVCVSFNNISDGEHVFRVAATYEGMMSPKATVRKYIGNDIPNAPTNVSMSFNKVVWEPVTEGEHGGYLNLDDMSYDVYINDEWIDNTSDTYLDIELPEGEIAPYSCYVYAVCSGKESAPGVSNTIVYGDPLDLDVEIIPTQEQAEIVTVLDANADESTWHARNYQDSIVFSYYADKVNSGDDWLFMPGITFEDAEALYDITFENCYYVATKPDEYYEIWLCAAPDIESERHCILEKTQPVSNVFEETSVGFTVPSAGVWYVAFRAVSNPDQMYLNIRNIKISQTKASLSGPEKAIPMSFTDKTMDGKFMSEVTFQLPETLINGESIPDSEEITVTVKGTTETTVKGAPGEVMTATVEVEEGFSNVSFLTSIGQSEGAESFFKVYAGPDVPGSVGNLSATVSEDNTKVTLTWTAPTKGFNGGSVSLEGLSYKLMIFNGKIWRYLPDTIEATTFTFEAEDPEELKNYPLSIEASNDKGSNDKDQPVIIVQLGKPVDLPVTENFADNQINVTPLAGYAVGEFKGTEWGLADPSPYGEEYALDGRSVMIGSASTDDATGRLMFPKFSTEGITHCVGVKLLLWTGNGSADMSIYAQCAGSEEIVEVTTIAQGNGWTEVEFVLPGEMSGCRWVQLWLDAEYPSEAAHAMLGEYMFYVTDIDGVVEKTMVTEPVIVASESYIDVIANLGTKVNIWTLDGISMGEYITTEPRTRIDLPCGFYVVCADGKTVKVFLR